MNKNALFFQRLNRKWTEHRKQDPSAFSFLAYCLKYVFVKSTRCSQRVAQALAASPHVDPDKLTIAVRITGGLGDAIVHRRILEKIAELCPAADFFLFCPVVKQSKWVFSNAAYIKAVLPLEIFSYFEHNFTDVTLHLNTFAYFNEEQGRWDKAKQLAPALLEIFAANRKMRRDWDVFIDRHPMLDGAFARQIVIHGFNRYTFIPHLLGIAPPPFALDLPMDMSTAEEIKAKFLVYVTINTGFDAYFVISGSTATKCYPKPYWTELVALLKKKFPALGIIQIGGKNSPHIAGTDFDLVGKTSLEQAAGILKGSSLHFDIEGGLVHVCASIGTRCVTLFGPTNMEYFGYPENIKLRDGRCPDCWWGSERWMECCPRQYPRPECMYRLTPEKVLEAAVPFLEKLSL